VASAPREAHLLPFANNLEDADLLARAGTLGFDARDFVGLPVDLQRQPGLDIVDAGRRSRRLAAVTDMGWCDSGGDLNRAFGWLFELSSDDQLGRLAL